MIRYFLAANDIVVRPKGEMGLRPAVAHKPGRRVIVVVCDSEDFEPISTAIQAQKLAPKEGRELNPSCDCTPCRMVRAVEQEGRRS